MLLRIIQEIFRVTSVIIYYIMCIISVSICQYIFLKKFPFPLPRKK